MRLVLRLTALTALSFGVSTELVAQDTQIPNLFLALPIDCKLGTDCFLQNYMDVDASTGAKDFHCNSLTYNNHKGTDFRLLNLPAMQEGVSVLAAATGTVTAIRDGEKDGLFWNGQPEAVSDKDCGNGVVIDHGDGWETQYCHLKEGSVSMVRGQSVEAGNSIAQVGMSGRSEFPHLHLSLRHKGVPVDPFTGKTEKDGCGQADQSMWKDNETYKISYVPVGLLNHGFADEEITNRGIEEQAYNEALLTTESPGFVYYVRVFGLRLGDTQEYTVLTPDGSELAQSKSVHEGTPKAQSFRFIGKRRPPNGWQPGTYEGHYRLIRNGVTLIDANKTATLR